MGGDSLNLKWGIDFGIEEIGTGIQKRQTISGFKQSITRPDGIEKFFTERTRDERGKS